MRKVGLEKYAYKDVTNLSGGEKQRVAIARAIVNNPDIILADEPTGALDTKTGEVIFNLLKSLSDNGKTVIIITHAKDIVDKMILNQDELELIRAADVVFVHFWVLFF